MGAPSRHLPAKPLLELVRVHGGPSKLGVQRGTAEQKAYERALRDGWVTIWAADLLACHLLGLPPVLVWGEEWIAMLSPRRQPTASLHHL